MKTMYVTIILISLFLLAGCTQDDIQHEIHFNSNGGSDVASLVTEGPEGLSMPPSPTREGFDFEGWYLDDGTFDIPFSSDSQLQESEVTATTVHAKWIPHQYALSFMDTDDTVLEVMSIGYGSDLGDLTLPSDPFREGYTFERWDNMPNTMPAQDISVVARYSLNTHSVVYSDFDDTVFFTTPYEYGADLSVASYPSNPRRQGYTFTGWTDMPDTMPDEEVHIQAQYSVNQYTMSFDTDGGTALDPINADYGEDIEIDEPTKTGHTFVGWYIDNRRDNEYIISTMPATDTTLYAEWAVNQYTMTFDTDGGPEMESITTDYNEVLSNPASPVKEGHAFEGWYTDSDFTSRFSFDRMPANDITVYAKWTVNQYTISFDTNAGYNMDPITEDYGTQITPPEAPEKSRRGFAGWYTDEDLTTEYQFSTMPANDMTLHAKWTVFIYSVVDNHIEITDYMGSEINLVIPEYINGYQVRAINENAFLNETQMETLEIPSSVTRIEANAFTSSNLFSGLANLRTVSFGENSELSYIGESAFAYADTLETIVIPSGVETIGRYAFAGAESLTDLTFEENSQLETIGERAFYNLYSLTSLTIPASVVSIGDYAFDDMSNLSTLTFEEGSQLTTIGDHAFYSPRSLTTLTIPNSVTSIGASAFAGAIDLTTLTFEENSQLMSIGENAFEAAISIESLSIPSGVTVISDYAFQYPRSLTSLTLPDGLTRIGHSAFSGANNLPALTLPNSLTTIDDYAFSDAGSLVSFTIPDSVTHIGYRAFAGATGVTSITVPDSVTYIGGSAFSGATSLTSITLPDGLTTIPSGIVSGAGNLTSFTIPENVTEIGRGAFSGTSLTSIILPEGLTMLGGGAFKGVTTLTSITIPSGVTSLDDETFMDAINLETIIIEESSQLTSIGSSAFENATSLTSIFIPAGVTSIGSQAFYNAAGLTTVTFEDGSQLETIGNYAFKNADHLGAIRIPDGTESIGHGAFSANRLETVYIPISVQWIGQQAFYVASNPDIYVEAETKPDGWYFNWTNSHDDVHWGYSEQVS